LGNRQGLSNGEIPARWRGPRNKLLPPISKLRRVKHNAALAYSELPQFIADVQAQDGIAVRALELTILSAARTNETIAAELDEINFADAILTVPANRMKAGKEHRFRCQTQQS
jgi:integrase